MRPLSLRERVYLGIFVLTLLWGLWNYRGMFSSRPGPGSGDATRPAVTQIQPAAVDRPAGTVPGGRSAAPVAAYRDAAAARMLPDWGPDPFHRGWRSTNTIATLAKPKVNLAPLRLSAIVIRDQVRYAVINGRVLGEGDTIEGRKVIRVEHSSVIIDEKGNTVRLSL